MATDPDINLQTLMEHDDSGASVPTAVETKRVPKPAGPLSSEETRELARWQRKLLPFMSRFLIVLAIIFFAVSAFSVYEMRSFILSDAGTPARNVVEEIINKAPASVATTDAVQKGLIVIEADALDKRYRQASALLLSRIWTRLLAFLTGMVLAFIGSLFIIGKLSGEATDVNFGRDTFKAGISSTSPGLILAFLGSTLMGIALVVQTPIDIQDRPIYFVTMGIKPVDSPVVAKPDPKALPDEPPIPNPFESDDAKPKAKQKNK